MQANKRINKHGVFLGLFLYRIPKAPVFYSSLKAGARLLKKHGYDLDYGLIMFDPYIQKARNFLVAEFLKSDCDTFIFIADDLEYEPEDLLKLIETPGDIVVGAYRQKIDAVHFPVVIFTEDIDGISRPQVREDGCIAAARVQTGFMRINRSVFEKFAKAYPDLSYYGKKDGKKINIVHDFFPQGVYNHNWIGEDYAFCDLWRKIGGKIWIIPDLNLSHWSEEGKDYPGNYHEYLKQLPGGIDEEKGKLDRVIKMRESPKQSLLPLIKALPINNGEMVGIGVYTGECIKEFIESKKFKSIHAVDWWTDGYNDIELPGLQGNMDVVEEIFDKFAKKYDIVDKIKNDSITASGKFKDNSLDFVYIDADHEYNTVKKDILAWMPKVKEGGYLGGHDYWEHFGGVIKAVDEIFGKDNIQLFPDSSWLIQILRSDSGITE